MNADTKLKGWVYVITNRAMPSIVKVGYTLKDPVLRAIELGGTGSPYPYEVVYDALVNNPREVERKAHEILVTVHDSKEWFRCAPSKAVEAIRLAADKKILLENFSISGEEQAHEMLPHNKYRDEWVKPGTYEGKCGRCGTLFKFTTRVPVRSSNCSKCLRDVAVGGFARIS